MKRLLTLIVTLLISFVASAESVENGRSMARQLVELLDVQESMQLAQESCGNELPGTNYDPKHVFESRPSAFQGITPDSHFWPEIEEAYRLYLVESCRTQDPSDLLNVLAKSYAEKLSIEELRAALAFYSSPVGRAFSKANKEASLAFQAYSVEKAAETQRKLEANFHSRLNATYARFRKEQQEQCRPSSVKKKI